MNFHKLQEACLAAGITEVEIYRVQIHGASVSTFNGAVDKNIVYNRDEMYVRGVYGGHIAALYVERDGEDEIESIVRRLRDNAGVIESEDPYFIYGGSDSYPTLPEEENDYDCYSQADKIEICRKMENYLREHCAFVTTTRASVDVDMETVSIENSSGLSVSRSGRDAGIACSAVIKKDGDVKQGYYFDHVRRLGEINFEKLQKFAIDRPLSAIGASSMTSGTYPVVFENRMFASLLSCFLSMFSGDAVTKKLSLLGDKLGQKVFGENITLTDEPLLSESPAKVTFDDEGVAAADTVVVENGVLKTFLHNLKTAKMLDAQSTGNGFKESSGAVGVRPTNLCLTRGERSFDEMISDIENGVFITQMMGQHAGVNAVSGAFNLQASGYRIENGKIAAPVTLIVVSGNILDVMNNVTEIASDFEVSGPIACGSVRIASLSVSGKEG